MKLPVNMIKKNDCRDVKQVARAERTVARLSLREVARRMKLSPSYLSYLELARLPWSQKHVDSFNAALKRGL